jgi:ABC-type transporter Mla subunit MlaD
MADFQSAVAETTSKLSTLLNEVNQTHEQLQTAKTEVNDLQQQIEQAWTSLNEQAQSLLESINSSKGELTTEAEGAEQAIAQLKQKIDTAQQELVQELEETKGAIAALDDHLAQATPELEADLQAAEEALSNLQEKEVGVELEQAVTQTMQELSTVSGELQGFQAELSQQVETVSGHLSEQILPEIAAGADGIGMHLDEIVTHFDEQIQAMGDGVRETMQGLLDQVQQGQENCFGQLEIQAQTLEEVMGKLESAIETAGFSVTEAGRAVVDGIELTTEGSKTTVQLLSDANEALEKF